MWELKKRGKFFFFWSRSRRRSFPSSLSSGVSMGRHMLLSHWPFCSASSHFLPLLDSQCSWNSKRVKKNLRKSSSLFLEFFFTKWSDTANDTHQRNVFCSSLRYSNNHLCTYWFFHYFWHNVSQLDPLLGNPGKKAENKMRMLFSLSLKKWLFMGTIYKQNNIHTYK